MLNIIKNRKSVRIYTDDLVSKEKLFGILEAAMSGPSARNKRPWEFIVVDDKETLKKMSVANINGSEPLNNAALAILICGNIEKVYKEAPDYWIIDCAIAAQNMILTAESIGLGSCWLGVWPQTEKMQNQSELFSLPQNIKPHSIITFGYPNDEISKNKVKKALEQQLIHFNGYSSRK